jgi:hypothetical protein
MKSTRVIPNKKFKWWAYLYVLLVLFSFYPYEFKSVYLPFFLAENYAIGACFFALTGLLLLTRKIKLDKFHSLAFVFLVQWIGIFIIGIAHGNYLPAIGISINMLLAFALVVFVDSLLNWDVFFDKYNKWILIMAILGCIVFFLVLIFNIQPLSIAIDIADGRPIFNYFLTFSKSDVYYTGIIRYAGFFDEPGAIAYWGVYALIINRLFIGKRRLETILAVSLLFTFSIGYYIQLLAYLVLFLVTRKNIIQSIFLTFLVGFTVWSISMTKDTVNSEIYDHTFGRIESLIEESQNESSIIAVGDREELTKNAIKAFKENPLFGTSRTDVRVGNNVYETLALYGIIGSAFLLFPFMLLIVWSIKNKDYTLLKCVVVISLGFTHRPFHTNVLSFFIIYCILVMYQQMRLRSKSAYLSYQTNS